MWRVPSSGEGGLDPLDLDYSHTTSRQEGGMTVRRAQSGRRSRPSQRSGLGGGGTNDLFLWCHTSSYSCSCVSA